VFKRRSTSRGLGKFLSPWALLFLLPAATSFGTLDPALFPAPTDLLSPLDTRDWKSETEPDLQAALQLVEDRAYDEALVKVKAVLAKDPDSAAAHEVLGVVLAKQNSLDEALKEFRQAAELDPHQSTPLTKMGDVYLAKKDLVNAKTYFLEAIALNPADYRANQRLGLIFQEEGDTSLAIDYFEKGIVGPPADYIGIKVDLASLYNQTQQFSKTVNLLEKLVHPETPDPAAHCALGTAYLALKRGNDAIASFTHMREYSSDPTRAQVALAVAYRETGDFQQSLKELDGAISSKPDWWAAYHEKGNTLAAMHNSEEAIQSYQVALKYSPAPVPIRNRIAEILADEKQCDAAAEAYEKIRSEGLATIETYAGLAAVYQAAGKFDDAMKTLQEACEKNPNSPYLFLRLGLVYGYRREYQPAKEALIEASTLSSADPRILKALSLVYLRTGDRPNAIEVAKRLLRTVPNSVQDRFYLGTLLDESKDYVGATAEYEQTLKLDPKYVLALNNLAITKTKLGKLGEALQLADQALALAPDNPALFDTQGWILYQRSEFAKASQTLEKAVAGDLENPTYRYHLAASYEKLGKRKQALDECNKAIESSHPFPERPEAQTLVELLKGS
jgi:tetratricopeptide (TPR) repeat protein